MELAVMTAIQEEKHIEITGEGLQPLDAEGNAIAEGKRSTFDVKMGDSDPLR